MNARRRHAATPEHTEGQQAAPLLLAGRALADSQIKEIDVSILDLFSITAKLEKLMTKLSEVADLINTVIVQIDKAKTEILNKIETLEQELADVPLPETAEEAFQALKARVQALDDIVPDENEPPAA